MLAEWFYNTTGKVPFIGAVEQAIGGTSIQSWVPNGVSIACNATGDLPSHGECAQKPLGWIYNGRVNPLALGFSARHALWYQGEADSGENDLMIKRGYSCLLKGLIESWRIAHRSNLTWTIIQLPGVQGSAFSNDTLSNSGEYDGWAAMQLAHGEAVAADPLARTFLNPIPDQGHGGLHVSILIQRVLRVCYLCLFDSVYANLPIRLHATDHSPSTATRSTSRAAQ